MPQEKAVAERDASLDQAPHVPKSDFLQLPPEIRNNIYHAAVHDYLQPPSLLSMLEHEGYFPDNRNSIPKHADSNSHFHEDSSSDSEDDSEAGSPPTLRLAKGTFNDDKKIVPIVGHKIKPFKPVMPLLLVSKQCYAEAFSILHHEAKVELSDWYSGLLDYFFPAHESSRSCDNAYRRIRTSILSYRKITLRFTAGCDLKNSARRFEQVLSYLLRDHDGLGVTKRDVFVELNLRNLLWRTEPNVQRLPRMERSDRVAVRKVLVLLTAEGHALEHILRGSVTGFYRSSEHVLDYSNFSNKIRYKCRLRGVDLDDDSAWE